MSSLYRLITVVAMLFMAWPLAIHAQEATPDSEPGPPSASECQVSPRSESEIVGFAATPIAQQSDSTESGTSGNSPLTGELVDAETLATITQTLRQVVACAEAGDLPRLIALYSDNAIRNFVLASEPVPIVPGQPPTGTNSRPATPPADADRTPVVLDARVQPDGRIAALVTSVAPGSVVDIVFFVKPDDRWVIDEIIRRGPNDATPEVGAGNPVVHLVLADAANQLGIPQSQLTVLAITPVEWPDASLGCPQEGNFYAQVITPGYIINITGAGQSLDYHTDAIETVVLCKNA